MGNLSSSISTETFVINIIFISIITLSAIALFMLDYLLIQKRPWLLVSSIASYVAVLTGTTIIIDGLYENVFRVYFIIPWRFIIPWTIIYFIAVAFPISFGLIASSITKRRKQKEGALAEREIQTKLYAFLSSKAVTSKSKNSRNTKLDWFIQAYGISFLESISDALEKINISTNHIMIEAEKRNINVDADINALQSLLNEKEKSLVSALRYLFDTEPNIDAPIIPEFRNHVGHVASHLEDIRNRLDSWFFGLNGISDGDDDKLAKKAIELAGIVEDTKKALNPEDYINGQSLAERAKKYND